MSNRAIWDVRQRHVWLSTQTKVKKAKLRTRKRCGLQEAIERKTPAQPTPEAEQAAQA